MKNFITLLSVLVYITVLAEENSDIRDDFPSSSLANTENLMTTIIAGKVSAITGDYIDCPLDIFIDGPEPLTLSRFYSDSSTAQREIGCAWDFAFPYLAYVNKNHRNNSKTNRHYWTDVREAFGGILSFHTSFLGHDDAPSVKLDICCDGYTNCGRGTPSGKTNIKNYSIELIKKDNVLRLKEGDGSLRVYYNPYSQLEGIYHLFGEERPNGTVTRYQYKNHFLGNIQSFHMGHNFGSIDIDKHEKYINISASNGQEVKYILENKTIKHRDEGESVNYISEVEHNDGPNEYYTYARQKYFPHYYHIVEKRVGQNPQSSHFTKIDYYSETKNYVSTSNSPIELMSIDPRKDRVKKIEISDGPIYEFVYDIEKFDEKYFCTSTNVYDAQHHLTKFKYTSYGRLHQIDYYSGNHPDQYKVAFTSKYNWNDEGSLISKCQIDPQGNEIKKQLFIYDQNHNVKGEFLFGELTGNGFSKYVRGYTYSQDGYNNLIKEWDAEGPIIQYGYLPDSDLMVSKFIREENGEGLRQFKHYENKLCVWEIFDNGTSPLPNSLKGVTERLIIRKKLSEASHSFGKPLQISTSYLDIPTRTEIPLKTVKFSYNKRGKVIKEEHYDAHDKLRYVINKAYDKNGNLIQENDPCGNTVEYNYDIYGNLVRKNGADKRYYNIYTYNSAHRLVSEQRIENNGRILANRTAYNRLGNPVKKVDFLGRTTLLRYDDFGNLTKEIYPKVLLGQLDKPGFPSQSWQYDLSGNPISHKLPNNSVITQKSTIRGQPLIKKYPDGSFERWFYSPAGRLLRYRKKDGTSIRYKYDRLGNTISEEQINNQNQSAGKTHFTWKGKRLIQVQDPSGAIRTYSYDGAGRLKEECKNGKKITFIYDELGRVSQETISSDPDNIPLIIIQKKYDLMDRIIDETTLSPENIILKRKQTWYDCMGREAATAIWSSENDFFAHFTKYDTFGRPVEVTDLDHNTKHIQYTLEKDPFSNSYNWVTTTVDPLGRIMIEKQDALDRVISIEIKDPFGNLLSRRTLKYNAAGELLFSAESLIEEGKEKSRQVYQWSYSPSGDIIQEIRAWKSPEQTMVRYKYKPGGIKTETIKPDGTVLCYSYDPKTRLSSLTDASKTVHYQYTYDILDRIVLVEDPLNHRSIRRDYNPDNFLIEEDFGSSQILKYAYDPLGQLTKIIYPDQSSTEYIYTGIHLTDVIRKTPSDQERYRHSIIQRNFLGKPIEVQLAGQAGKLFLTYDREGRPLQIDHSSFSQTINERDKEHKPLKISYKSDSTSWDEELTYDTIGNLSNEHGELTKAYRYDSLKNRISVDGHLWTHNRHNQLIQTDQEAFTYDMNGNMTRDKDKKYRYDALDRLIEVETSSNLYKYEYDSDHRRLKKSIFTKETSTDPWKIQDEEFYLYVGNDEIASYATDGTLNILRILADGKGAEIGATAAIEMKEKVIVPIHDLRGSICSLVDSETSQTLGKYRYSAFGQLTKAEGSLADQCPWRFSGKRHDPETNFVYFCLRYYAPHVGRWTTLDPGGYAEGPNGYLFVQNSPYTQVDLYGQFGFDFIYNWLGFDCWNSPSPVSFWDGYENHYTRPDLDKPKHRYEFENEQSASGDSRYRKKVSQGSFCKDIDGYEDPRLGMGFTGGINTSSREHMANAKHISDLAGGYKVRTVYNASFGIISDLIECLLGHFRIATTPVKRIHQMLDNYFKNAPEDGIFLLYCHSQGAINVWNALDSYDKELLKRIHVIAIAPAKFIPKNTCGSVMHYVNDNDIVPKIDIPGMRRARREGTVVMLPSAPGEPYLDHKLRSKTYRNKIEYEFKRR